VAVEGTEQMAEKQSKPDWCKRTPAPSRELKGGEE